VVLNRSGKAAVALSCVGALLAVGCGSGGHGERPGPKPISAPDGDAPVINSLRNGGSIPSLRERKSQDLASPPVATNPHAGASAPTGGTPEGSGTGGSSKSVPGDTTGPPAGGTTSPSPTKNPPRTTIE